MHTAPAGAIDGGGSLSTARRDLWIAGAIVAGMVLAAGWAMRIGATARDATAMLILVDAAALMFGWRRYRALADAIDRHERADAARAARAFVDTLTGLPLREGLITAGAGPIRAAAGRRGGAVAALIVDLDRFRRVNETHGRATGDATLRAVALALRGVLPPTALVARLEEDRFAILASFEPYHGGTIDALADHIVGLLAQPIAAGGTIVRIGASIGIARSDDGFGGEIEGLLDRAMVALHAAKDTGRGRHGWFDRAIAERRAEQERIERDLRDAIAAGHIRPWYDRQTDLETGRVTGFTIVPRWDHPSRGLIAADRFVPAAERCGLTGDLAAAVLRAALAEARDWDPSLTVSMRLSADQLADPWLAQKIVKLLIEHGFPGNRLEIVIGEDALYRHGAAAASILGSLRNQGIRLALGDVGTGRSILACLQSLPFDRILIDRALTAAATAAPAAMTMAATIARLGQSLGLAIAADGIADADTAARLLAHGCGAGRGGLFGEPMAVDAVRRLLAERGLLPAARVAVVPEARRRSA